VDDRTADLRRVLAESDDLVEQLSTMAMRDHLTGLLNRRYLERELPLRIADAARSGTTLAVVLIDLVNFKQVNDRYSHDVGDRVLTEAATSLAATLPPGDTITRFGGDEFVVLAQAPNDAALPALIAQMRQALATAELPESPGVTLGLAYGVALYSGQVPADPEAVAQEVLRSAESDLRRRRATGGGGPDGA
jgi:diguanylate cyclase (GGDEF)-like protein